MDEVWTLQRSTTDGKLAGVCAAVATRYRIDPLLVRIVAVLLALSAGIGLALYAAAWALLPSDRDPVPPVQRLLPGTAHLSRTTWMWLIGAWTVLVGLVLGQFLTIGLGPVLVVAALWWFGVIKPRANGSARRSTAALPANPSERAFLAEAEAWRSRVDAQVRVDWEAPATVHRHAGPVAPAAPALPPAMVTPSSPQRAYEWQPAPWAALSDVSPAPVPYCSAGAAPSTAADVVPAEAPAPAGVVAAAAPHRRRRRVLAWGTVALAAVSCTAMASHGTRAEVVLAVALLVLGLGLVAAAWLGRPRGMLPAAIVLLLVVLGTLGPTHAGESLVYSVTDAADLPATISAPMGDVTVDLSQLSVPADRTVTIRMAAGDVTVVCPESANVVVESRLAAGTYRALGTTQDGPGNFRLEQRPDPSAPTLVLKVDVALGDLTVVRP